MRYIVGIDLGTTNCSAAFVDMEHPSLSVQPFTIPQLNALQQKTELETLPSFCYLTPEGHIVGEFAKSQGAVVPTRVIDSAKSWLCLGRIHRKEKILPFIAEDESRKMSPVEAQTAYLAHIRDSWNAKKAKNNPDADLRQQHIIVTVPASFDEVARELTFEAAEKAGFVHVTLLEEPQAAFYYWLSKNENHWKESLLPGQRILVCDVGGGTTDFSLIERTEDGFRRMAVGSHLLLGGDNMDRAVAHYLEQKLPQQLSNTQWQQLRYEARTIKEKSMSQIDGPSYSVCIQGAGSSVVGGSLTCEVESEDIRRLLMEGFWKFEDWEEAIKIKKPSGFKTFGLPFEDEPSIVKHLAHFLHQHQVQAPHYVLFNGGTMTPQPFQEALVSACAKWFSGHAPQVLSNESLDLAVSGGAAYFGKVRFGDGVKISGGISRSYYIEVDDRGVKKAMAILPREAEENDVYDPGRTFYVSPNTPVSFRMFSSHIRLGDQQGDIVEVQEEEFHQLPPIHTVIRFGKTEEKIPVHVLIRLTEIGTLEIWLQSQKTDHKWKLEFQLESEAGHEASKKTTVLQPDELVDRELLNQGENVIFSAFRDRSIQPKDIISNLEELIEKPRSDWGPGILRGLWPSLISVSDFRMATREHEMRWWNLAGYLLRPGFGVPLDDHRIKEVWKIILGDYQGGTNVHQWICFRRISGGLNQGQQRQLAKELIKTLLDGGKIKIKSKSDIYPYSEKIRALASMEFLDQKTKVKLGHAVLQRLVSGKGVEADYWALGRLGARHLLYGSVVDVVSKETCSRWAESLLDSRQLDDTWLPFLLRQLAGRTEYREVNLTQDVVEKITVRFPNLDLSVRELEANERDRVFGDHLPAGLSLSDPLWYDKH